jgi:hypothetical protein
VTWQRPDTYDMAKALILISHIISNLNFFMCEKGQIITLISYIINKLAFVMCDKGQILLLHDISSTKKSNSN